MVSTAKNKGIMLVVFCLKTMALLCATGTFMQVFLSSVGFTGKEIYTQTCLVQAANFLSIFLFSRFADKGNLFRRCFATCFAGGLLFLGYLPLCFREAASPVSFALLLGVSCIQAITTGLYVVCEYKLPYFIYKAAEYGRFLAVCGIISSVISFVAGALVSGLSETFSYSQIMFVAFTVAAAFLCLAGVLQCYLTRIDCDDDKKQEDKKIPTTEMLKQPVFFKLIIPNFLRGFASGITAVFAVVASDYLGYSEQSVTMMVSAHAVVTLAACAIFGIAAKRIPYRFMVLMGSLLFVLMPILLIGGQPILFVIVTSVIMFGRIWIDYALPSLLIYVVPVEIAGPYHAYRMFLTNAGSFAATALATVLSTPAILILAMIAQLVMGVCVFSLPVIRKAKMTC